jgi:prevent-host-death family protein
MKKLQKQISATEFKKHFLSLVDEVKNKHSSFIITKRKVPIAQIVPLPNEVKGKKSYFGCTKGVITINDDIVNESFESDWEVNND